MRDQTVQHEEQLTGASNFGCSSLVAAISELLKPYDARLMRCYPVSSRVNHVMMRSARDL